VSEGQRKLIIKKITSKDLPLFLAQERAEELATENSELRNLIAELEAELEASREDARLEREVADYSVKLLVDMLRSGGREDEGE
jgi:hypothetical protein